jgi:hypothetical protein
MIVEECFRQTGGFLEVPSGGAVFDRERSLVCHHSSPIHLHGQIAVDDTCTATSMPCPVSRTIPARIARMGGLAYPYG